MPTDYRGLAPTGSAPHDTEDKVWYVKFGRDLEDRFVDQIVPKLGLPIRIHPDKATNPYGPDLLWGDKLADLKHQTKPFFTSQRYGIAPQFAVTFNLKDYRRYSDQYPGITIFWWIERFDETAYGATVRRMNAVWRTPFAAMAAQIEAGKIPLHELQGRRDDTKGNSKANYLFDVRDFELLWKEL